MPKSTSLLLIAFLFYSTSLTGTDILKVQAPNAEERVAAVEVYKLPKVSSRQINLTTNQKSYYSKKYANFVFNDDSRYVRGLPLGVTGIYAMDSKSRNDLYVYFLVEKSPAKNIVKEKDIIIGANGRLFKDFSDARKVMGLSLAESQGSLNGKLYLHLMRSGVFKSVTVDVGTEIPYAKAFPFNCKRSKKMADKQIEILKSLYRPEFKLGEDWWNVLMLMASDDLEAQQIARRAVYELKVPQLKRLASWYLGYELIILSEYYLLTGDSNILPSIEKYAEILQKGMFQSGSWGHGLGFNTYGEVNATGLTCFMGLALAKKCGVRIDEAKFQTSYNFFKKFRIGRVPYGNNPIKLFDRANNGKAGMAAVVFNLVGDHETSRMFAEPSCYSYDFREGGHAEGLFNFAWGPLGAMHASKGEYELFMNNMIWYYELARTTNGNFDYLRGGRFNSRQRVGGMGLFLMMPGKKLQILNAEPSVFSIKAPAGAEKAAQLYKEKKWTGFLKLVKTAQNDPAGEYISKLNDTFQTTRKVASLTLQSIKKCIAEKNFEGAQNDLNSLVGQLGPSWPGLSDLAKDIEKGLRELVDDKKKKRRGVNFNQAPSIPKDYKITRKKRSVVLNGWTVNSEIIAKELSDKMKDMPIVDVIRHTIHPHDTFKAAACMQVLKRKAESRPLIEGLLKHNDHRFRAIAVFMLGAFEADVLKRGKWGAGATKRLDAKEISAELAKSLKLVRPLLNDESLEVQEAIANFLNLIAIRGDVVDEMLLELSKSKHLKVITGVLSDAPVLVRSSDNKVKLVISTMKHIRNMSGADINKVNTLINRLNDFDFSPYLKDFRAHIRDNILLRKGLYAKDYINIFKRYPDHDEVKKSIKLLCQLYTRKHLSNIEIRKLFEKMDKKLVASQINEFVPEETKWLNDLLKNHPRKFKELYAKEEFSRACIDELKQLAADLSSGKAINHSDYEKWADQHRYMNMLLVVAKHNGENEKAFKARMKKEAPPKKKKNSQKGK